MWIAGLADNSHKMSSFISSEKLTLNWTLKSQSQTQQMTFYFLFSLYRENKTWHFMWIICLVDDSHEMSSFIYFEK